MIKISCVTEAVAIYCLYSMKGQYNLGIGASFMIVDCGGDTVDLTTRQLLDGNKMSEVTERTGNNFGSSFIDQEFVKFLGLCYWSRLEESDWLIEIEFKDIKAMFDPVIGRIIRLIRGQLKKRNKKSCSALMLTDVFNESRYLQARIRQEFGVPIHPIIASGGLQEEKEPILHEHPNQMIQHRRNFVYNFRSTHKTRWTSSSK
ncbi:hypothetical protein C1646_741658 [Rhizophagus diaphanus]|nr:hypothetical protein C1646_741658 [Rhizophagus diaphanus] [Rhizophagus sp. MUCL 43196]